MQTKYEYKRQTSFLKFFKGLEGNNQYIYSDFFPFHSEFCIFPSFLLAIFINYLKFNIYKNILK